MLNGLANNYKRIYYNESFKDYLKSFKAGVKKIYTRLSSGVLNFLKDISKKFVKAFTNKKEFENKAKSLYYSGLTESNNRPLPNEQQLGDKYSDKKEFQKLVSTGIKSLNKTKKKLDSFGDNVMTRIDINENIEYTNNYKEIRYLYYNIVSLLVLEDFILNLKSFSEFAGIEVAMVYGNTKMPLVKVYGNPNNYIEYLPIEKKNKQQEKLPVFGLIINKSNKHYAFYMNFLSTIHDKPEYLSIQMRTKQEKQYVIDGQGYYSVEKTLKKFNI